MLIKQTRAALLFVRAAKHIHINYLCQCELAMFSTVMMISVARKHRHITSNTEQHNVKA